MKINKTIKNLPLIGSVFILIAYLIVIMVTTNFYSTKILDTYSKEVEFRTTSYADWLGCFFMSLDKDVREITNNKAIFNYISDKSTSKNFNSIKLKNSLFKSINEGKGENAPSFFSSITFVDSNNHIISTNDTKLHISDIDVKQLEKTHHYVVSHKINSEIEIQLIHGIELNHKLVGVIVADINKEQLKKFLFNKRTNNKKSTVVLQTPSGSYNLWNKKITQDNIFNYNLLHNDNLIFHKPIKGTNFYLNTTYSKASDFDFFSIKNILIFLFILTCPLFMSLLVTIKLNSLHINAKKKYSGSLAEKNILSEQKKVLINKNQQLEKEVSLRHEMESHLTYQASHDMLTELTNRQAADKHLETILFEAKLYNYQSLVIFIDLDKFKEVNDTHGHQMGDQLLKQVAKRLKNATRESDITARIGGDEFLVIVPRITNHDTSKLLAQKIVNLFSRPFSLGHDVFISASLGLAFYPEDGKNATELLAHADTAMYQVKTVGRNNFALYNSEMNATVLRNNQLLEALQYAENENKDLLEVYYQPLMNIKTNKIVGAEALLRWNDPILGHVSPSEFIPIAENNGLIETIGARTLNIATKQASQWNDIQPFRISVNLSCVQFNKPQQLFDSIIDTLNKNSLSPDLLTLEITENLLLEKNDDTLDLLININELGVKLSIDDFGTGYSSLSYIWKFPFRQLKIDREFLDDMQNVKYKCDLIDSIIAMGNSLNLSIVAEGIEDEWQRDWFSTRNCDLAQGFYFHKPMKAAQLEALLLEQNKQPEV